jgi:hypothetical protein
VKRRDAEENPDRGHRTEPAAIARRLPTPEEAIRADHERHRRIANQRAANPRYKPDENDPPWRI